MEKILSLVPVGAMLLWECLFSLSQTELVRRMLWSMVSVDITELEESFAGKKCCVDATAYNKSEEHVWHQQSKHDCSCRGETSLSFRKMQLQFPSCFNECFPITPCQPLACFIKSSSAGFFIGLCLFARGYMPLISLPIKFNQDPCYQCCFLQKTVQVKCSPE